MNRSLHSLLVCFTASLLFFLSSCQNESSDGSEPTTSTEKTNTAPTENESAEETPILPEPSESSAETAIKAAYAIWLQGKIDSGEYVSEEDCGEFRQRMWNDDDFDPEDFPVGLPSEPDYSFGDLNGDGVLDGFAMAPMDQCDGGNALHASEENVVFVSQPDGNYLTLDTGPWASLGVGNIGEIIDGEIIGFGIDYDDDDPRCCPSISWEVKYKVIDNAIVETYQSEKVHEEEAGE